jgi:hypothetical protein
MENVPERPLKDFQEEELNRIMVLLINGRLGQAGRDFRQLCGVSEENFPAAIEKIGQFADTVCNAGMAEHSADLLNEALYAYFFRGLLFEYEGRRKMDQNMLAKAHGSWEFVEAIAGLLDSQSHIFQCGLLDKFGLRETMRRRMDRIKVLFTRIERKQEAGT